MSLRSRIAVRLRGLMGSPRPQIEPRLSLDFLNQSYEVNS